MGDLSSKDLFDPLGHIIPAATSGLRGEESPLTAATEVGFDRLPRQLRDRLLPPGRLMTEPGIEFVGQLDRRPLHGMSAYPEDRPYRCV